jgi:hypothetical protein
LATTVAELVARLTADTSHFEKGMNRSESGLQRFAKGARRYALGITAALTTAGVFSVKAAVNLGEQVNKATVVFRGSEKVILDWAKTTADSIGISNRAALEAAGTFGNMLVPMGFARKEAANMSKNLVNLAADMASFNNASPEETLDALRSGLAGESEPLRKFGVFLSDARLKQEALRLGLYDGVGALSASAKAQATYALILKDTKDAQGDFGRTSGSLANQQRILRAEMEDAAAQLGTSLIPALTKVAKVLSTVIGWTQQHATATKILVGVLGGAAVAVWALNFALAANPIGLVILAIAGLTAALVLLYTKSAVARAIIQGVFRVLGVVVLTFAQYYLKMISGFLHGLELMARGASHLPFIGKHFKGVADKVHEARVKVDELRNSVGRLKSKLIHVDAKVSGLSYVMALQEHLALIKSQGAHITVSGPNRQFGGPVQAGHAYVVGERRPELFVPRTSGTILPSVPRAAMAGGLTVNINGPVYGTNAKELARKLFAPLREEAIRHMRMGGTGFP